uniref:FAD-dependent pyridine nucleotide-disulphide oxidoreductase n=1 Tax=Polynucleobacter necessarius subsp. necessarius (strain STIR1) TaxID=452638 RepID=B1XTJ2_POLNS
MICGGGDAALDWAIHFCEIAASVTLIHRRDDFKAAPKSTVKMRELCNSNRLQLLIEQATTYESQEDCLTGLTFTNTEGETQQLPFDDLLVFFGLSPKLGPISDWGLNLDRKQICIDTQKFQTSVPGIYAVGDINVYPGKKNSFCPGFTRPPLPLRVPQPRKTDSASIYDHLTQAPQST